MGLGYVGATTAACLLNDGHHVYGIDIRPAKVEMIGAGRSPVVEPGVAELLAAGVAAGRLSSGPSLAPWLERLDHHYEIYGWDVPWLEEPPSAVFRRQAWISFDPDESTLPFTARSPLVGVDRIVWASDFPHPDAKFPGTTNMLAEAVAELTFDEQAKIVGRNAADLYGLDLNA